MKRLLVTFGFAATMILAGRSVPSRADVVYGIDSGSSSSLTLNTVNASNGAIIGANMLTGFPTDATGVAYLAYDPTNQMLYGAVVGTYRGTELVEINPNTAVGTTIGLINGGTGIFRGLAFDSTGDLYSIQNPTVIGHKDSIDQISLTSGAVLTSQELTANVSGGFLTGSPTTGALYVAYFGNLATIQLSSGMVTSGPTIDVPYGGGLSYMSFYGTTLYGVGTGTGSSAGGGQYSFGTINQTTGVLTSVDGTVDPVYAFAAAPGPASVPEPASIALLVGGALGLGLWRWKTARTAKRRAI